MPIWNSEEKIEKISKELLLPDPGGFPGQSDISPVDRGQPETEERDRRLQAEWWQAH